MEAMAPSRDPAPGVPIARLLGEPLSWAALAAFVGSAAGLAGALSWAIPGGPLDLSSWASHSGGLLASLSLLGVGSLLGRGSWAVRAGVPLLLVWLAADFFFALYSTFWPPEVGPTDDVPPLAFLVLLQASLWLGSAAVLPFALGALLGAIRGVPAPRLPPPVDGVDGEMLPQRGQDRSPARAIGGGPVNQDEGRAFPDAPVADGRAVLGDDRPRFPRRLFPVHFSGRDHRARQRVPHFTHERSPLLFSVNPMLTEYLAPYPPPTAASIPFDIVFSEMAKKRKYEMRKRAELQSETRRRIVEATVELHRTRGPAHTTISEIAQRAGVNRLTVYNHFPDTAHLLSACSGRWTEQHPRPDPAPWAEIRDPQQRLRTVLTELYGYYTRTEPMRANVLRDAETMPELAALLEATFVPYLGTIRELLAEGWEVRERGRGSLIAALRLATDFRTWRSLERGSGLHREEAVELMLGAVRSTVSRPELP